jgi:hypothetical protein
MYGPAPSIQVGNCAISRKTHGLHFYDTYITIGEFSFIIDGSLEEGAEAGAMASMRIA